MVCTSFTDIKSIPVSEPEHFSSKISHELFQYLKTDDRRCFEDLLQDPKIIKQVDDNTLIQATILSLGSKSGEIRGTLFDEFLRRFHNVDVDPCFMGSLHKGYKLLHDKKMVVINVVGSPLYGTINDKRI